MGLNEVVGKLAKAWTPRVERAGRSVAETKMAAKLEDGAVERALGRDRLTLSSGVAERAASKPHMLADLPQAMQMNSYSCGVGSTQAVLAYYDPDKFWTYQKPLAKALGTTSKEGTNPHRMVGFLNQQGLKATLREHLTLPDLERYVDQGVPVIIDYQAYGKKGVNYAKDWADGHYSVVRGYDEKNIYLMDPSLMPGTTGYVSKAELGNRWHDYEIEKGQRREYMQMGIVVEGHHAARPQFVHTD